MGSYVQLVSETQETFTVPAPQYGYRIEVVNPFHFQRKTPSGYSSFDDGTEYDYRIFDGEFILSETDSLTMINFYRMKERGRGVEFGMRLLKYSGFTPFGPDKGDYGNYAIVMYEMKPTGSLVSPNKYFAVSCKLLANTFPSVSEPDEKLEGPLQIGTVTGLRFPVNYPSLGTKYGIDVSTTRGGDGHIIDKNEDSDHYETTLSMICNRSRTYALINYLVNTARTNDITITAPEGTYLFGRENDSGGIYNCKWINERVIINHANFDRYEFELKFSLVK